MKTLDECLVLYSKYKKLPHMMTFPKIPILYTWINGKYFLAWKTHDKDYTDKTCSRSQADYDMRMRIIDLGGSKVFAYCAWLAVRVFGYYHWRVED